MDHMEFEEEIQDKEYFEEKIRKLETFVLIQSKLIVDIGDKLDKFIKQVEEENASGK